MSYFPQLQNGQITQLPYKMSRSFNSVFQEIPLSRPYSVPRRGSGLATYPTGPLCRFEVVGSVLTDAEIVTLQTFFQTQQGRLGTFSFLDPGGNLVQNSDLYSAGTWTLSAATIAGTGIADPFGGTLATNLTSSSGSAKVSTVVLPSGGATGFWLCFSIYVKASIPGQSVTLGFTDTTSSTTIASQAITIPANLWTRISFPTHLATNHNIGVFFGSWLSASTLSFYGAQCSPMPGPGAYRRSSVNYGLHAKCRFDQDSFQYQTRGINQNSITLAIQETN